MRFRQIQRSQGVERIERPLPWNPTLALWGTRSSLSIVKNGENAFTLKEALVHDDHG